MSYWDYEEPYWEPSEADELFDEIKSKLLAAAKDSLKNDIETLKSRNEYLERRNNELESKAQDVQKKERDLEYKSSNLRSEVEREFYKTAITDMFINEMGKAILWFADDKPHIRPKCDNCNDERMWALCWPNGEVITRRCDCACPAYWYEPQETYISMLKYKVKDSNYKSERYYSLDRSYQNTKSSYDDYSYNSFDITFVFDKFNDEVIERHKQLGYNKHIGFKTKEECQKYCNWLNDKKNTEECE